jgi:hypothetical protein
VTERPGSRVTQVLCGIAIVASLGASTWLIMRIARTAMQPHPFEFVGLAWLIGLCAYFWWSIVALRSLQYTWQPGHLMVRQWPKTVSISLEHPFQLMRWRKSWRWGRHDELGDHLSFYPPLGTSSELDTWVVTYLAELGATRSIVIRPSKKLLQNLRDWQSQLRTNAS